MHRQDLKSGVPATLENKKKVLTKALIAMANILQLSQKDLSEIIGPSTATFSRIFYNTNFYINPETKEGQLALLLLRFYRSLDVLFGGNANQCRVWLRSSNNHLSGTPIELIKSIEGLVFVIQYLDAMRGKN
jgi:hypothetical protein